MAKTRIKYNGADLANTPIKNGQKATIPCKDKMMSDNITVESEHLKLQSKVANANGTVTFDSATYDGLKEVVVSVNPSLEEKTVTPSKSTQNVTPESAYGLSKVVVNPIPDDYIIPANTKTIDTVGEHDVKAYAKVNANFPLETKRAEVNGDITPSSGFFGLSKVTVAIPTFAGTGINIEDLPKIATFTLRIVNSSIGGEAGTSYIYPSFDINNPSWSAFLGSSKYNDGSWREESGDVQYNGENVKDGADNVTTAMTIKEGYEYTVTVSQ